MTGALAKRTFHGLTRLLQIAAKTIGVLILAVVVLVVAFAAAFFAIPRLELGSDRLAKLAEKARGFGVEMSWKDAVFSLERTAWHSKAVRLHAEDLCAKWKPPAVEACFARIDFGFEAGLFNEETNSIFDAPTRVYPIVLLGGRVRADLDAFPKEEQKEEEPGGFSIVDFARKKLLPRWDAGGSRIELAELAVDSGKKRFRASADLSTEGPVDRPPEALKLELTKFVDEAAGYPSARGSFAVRWPEGSSSQDGPRAWKARLETQARISRKQSANVEADATARGWNDVDYLIYGRFKGFDPLKTLSLAGLYKEDHVSGKASLTAGAYGSALTAASAVNCGYEAALNEKNANLRCGPETVRISIRETVAPESLREKRSLFVLRPTFEFKATNVSFGDKLGADVALSLQLASADLLSLEANAEAKVSEVASGAGGDAAPKSTTIEWNARAQTKLDLPEFARLTQFLRGTPFAVPAPLNGLSGPIRAKVEAQIDQDGGRAPFELKTELSSMDQRVFLAVDGAAEMAHESPDGWRTKVRVRARADDVRLSAPRLALKAPPQLAPDGRFRDFEAERRKAEEARAQPPSKTSFIADIQTASPGSIQIATNMTAAPIPLSVDLATRAPPPSPPAAMRGSVVIGKTPIRFLRRNATVEGLRVDFLPDGRRRLDGRLSVDYPDYDIQVFVTGYGDAPQLRFESEPPLPQDQILAALLFGRPINQLSADERSSAANMNAAVADAALSLSSLYILADTPIEGVGYDSERGLVTARVGLGGGNSLELGSGSGGAAEVGVRRKLSRDLVFNTYVERVGETDEKVVSAFLEWVKKF